MEPSRASVAKTRIGTYAYGYSAEGLKLTSMLEHPWVCFEVDDVRSLADWRCVIAYGWFEMLFNGAATAAIEYLSARRQVAAVTRRGGYGVVYRIAIVERSGRFERPL